MQPSFAMSMPNSRQRGRQPLTLFEAFTVLTFACFAKADMDVVVLEVGMGGEWDCTNVADGQVAVIEPIDLDHTQFLGPTIEAIAKNKTGIIKADAFVVSSEQVREARAPIEEAVQRTHSTVAFDGEDFGVDSVQPTQTGQRVTLRGIAGTYENIDLPLLGVHQAHNAALAVAAVEAFPTAGKAPLPRDVVARGIGEAQARAGCRLSLAIP
uniref:Mur ligase family protein n=2 Tax=Curtobacterium poinsettiae TaxID=159612 RepID=UPI002B40B84C|nr:Mur ligase family protein [Curtobacterium flaccumfaciens]WQM79382.1 hypothetical protein PCFP11_175 [Curtobacterium flaccumfaciens pv. poinsettiae]